MKTSAEAAAKSARSDLALARGRLTVEHHSRPTGARTDASSADMSGAEKGMTSSMTPMPKFQMALAVALFAAALAGAPQARAQGQSSVAPPLIQDAPKTATPSLSEGVAAIVNDNVISTFDLNQRVRLLLVTTGVRPTEDNLPQIEREALRMLVDERLEAQEIIKEEKEQKFKIMADDNDVNHEIDRMAQSSGLSGKQLVAALTGAGVSPNTLREQLRVQVSWARWIQGRYGGSRLKISDDRINAVLRQIEAEAAKPQYLIAEIYIDAARAGGLDAAVQGAQQIIGQLQQGAPFPAIARQFSASSTAANGGDAGWLTASEMPEEVRAAVEQMRPGNLSQPLPVRDGVYIILLRDKRAGAGSFLVKLKQAAISLPADAPADQVEAARQKLVALKAKITSCDALEAEAGKVDGVIAGDLGEADIKDLAPGFRDAASGLQLGQVSDPLRTQAGLHLIALCGRRRAGVTLPPREEVEARLQDEQLSLLSKRYLRDLRSSATIETR
jgi:peptidyl-prolyl cis-trans isomerase SurA